jgi:hypothetical protein
VIGVDIGPADRLAAARNCRRLDVRAAEMDVRGVVQAKLAVDQCYQAHDPTDLKLLGKAPGIIGHFGVNVKDRAATFILSGP